MPAGQLGADFAAQQPGRGTRYHDFQVFSFAAAADPPFPFGDILNLVQKKVAPAGGIDLFPVEPIDLLQQFDGIFGGEKGFFQVDSQELIGLFTIFQKGADHLGHQGGLAAAPYPLEQNGLFLVQLADAAPKQVAGNPGIDSARGPKTIITIQYFK